MDLDRAKQLKGKKVVSVETKRNRPYSYDGQLTYEAGKITIVFDDGSKIEMERDAWDLRANIEVGGKSVFSEYESGYPG